MLSLSLTKFGSIQIEGSSQMLALFTEDPPVWPLVRTTGSRGGDDGSWTRGKEEDDIQIFNVARSQRRGSQRGTGERGYCVYSVGWLIKKRTRHGNC